MPPSGPGSSIQDRARTGAAVDPQDGLFDHQWEDGDLIADLEEREEKRAARLDAQKAFKLADDKVKNRLLNYSLAVGEVARVGRFRIKKRAKSGGHVEFDRAPGEQLSIGTVGDD